MTINVPTTATPFGRSLDLTLPEGADIIVVCRRKSWMVPLAILLPHQLYEEKLAALLEADGPGADLVVIPVRSSEYIVAATTYPAPPLERS